MYVQYVKTLFPTANPSGTTCSSTIVMFKAVGKVSINECNKNVQCTRVLKSAELRKLGPEVKARLIVCRDRSGYALDRLWQALAMLWLCSG